MKVTVVGDQIYVALSARNLRHLNKMLEVGAGSSLARRDGAHGIHVCVESDEVHYRDREAGPGADVLFTNKAEV